jgi:protein SCO1/2
VAAADPAAAPNPKISAVVGGPFTLIDQDGRTVTEETYRGKWLLVYFGYTHCPDTCPMTLGNIDAALAQLDPGMRARIQAIFVTVDPERDTPAVMKDYVGAFPEAGIVGLSGTPEQVTMIEKAYRIFVQRHDAHDGDYSMDHTSVIHIVDPAGKFAGLASDLMGPDRLAARLRQLVS